MTAKANVMWRSNRNIFFNMCINSPVVDSDQVQIITPMSTCNLIYICDEKDGAQCLTHWYTANFHNSHPFKIQYVFLLAHLLYIVPISIYISLVPVLMITGPTYPYPCRFEYSHWLIFPTPSLHYITIQLTFIVLTFGSCRRAPLCIFRLQHRAYQRVPNLTSPLPLSINIETIV